jgi:hypothetical protein
MVELHDFIHFSFECDHPGIMIGLDILYLDPGELGKSLFDHFFNYYYFLIFIFQYFIC